MSPIFFKSNQFYLIILAAVRVFEQFVQIIYFICMEKDPL